MGLLLCFFYLNNSDVVLGASAQKDHSDQSDYRHSAESG